MVPNLPKPIADYYEANNVHDIDGMLAAFADNAVVHDEGKQISGRDTIRAWMNHTTGKYQPTFTAIECTVKGGKTVVATEVVGTFPGSPIVLIYEFEVAGSKIAKLRVS